MPSVFKNIPVQVTNTQTQIYVVPALTTAIVFSGHISNVDTTNKAAHNVTLEHKVGAVYYSRLQDVPIAYGGSLTPGKMVLQAGESLYITGDANSVMEAVFDILEKS